MIRSFSKAILIAITIFCAAYYLPYAYRMLFESYERVPFTTYSALKKDFFFYRMTDEGLNRMDSKGEVYTQEECDSLLPLFNYRQLYSEGKMPDSVQGRAISTADFKKWNYSLRLRPQDISGPQVKLYPLLESNSGRVRLSMPDDVFSLQDGIAFLDTESNTVNQEKSARFDAEFKALNFQFPGKAAYGNPSTRKAYDWGYFIVDAADQLFHLKMIKGKPFLRAVSWPEAGTKVAHFAVTENSSRKYFATIMDQKGQIFYLQSPDYSWHKVPLEPINVKTSNVSFFGNPLYHIIRVHDNTHLKAYALDHDFNLEKKHVEELPRWETQTSGKAMAYLFPFQVEPYEYGSSFVHFHIGKYAFTAIFVNLLFAIALLFFQKRKSKQRKIISALVVLLSGIYGFIALLIFDPDQEVV